MYRAIFSEILEKKDLSTLIHLTDVKARQSVIKDLNDDILREVFENYKNESQMIQFLISLTPEEKNIIISVMPELFEEMGDEERGQFFPGISPKNVFNILELLGHEHAMKVFKHLSHKARDAMLADLEQFYPKSKHEALVQKVVHDEIFNHSENDHKEHKAKKGHHSKPKDPHRHHETKGYSKGHSGH